MEICVTMYKQFKLIFLFYKKHYIYNLSNKSKFCAYILFSNIKNSSQTLLSILILAQPIILSYQTTHQSFPLKFSYLN